MYGTSITDYPVNSIFINLPNTYKNPADIIGGSWDYIGSLSTLVTDPATNKTNVYFNMWKRIS